VSWSLVSFRKSFTKRTWMDGKSFERVLILISTGFVVQSMKHFENRAFLSFKRFPLMSDLPVSISIAIPDSVSTMSMPFTSKTG